MDPEEQPYEQPVYTIPLDEVLAFVRMQTKRPDAGADSDLFADLHCTGKSFNKLVEAFGREFNVDVTGYKWYFHTDEDDHSIGTMLFKPPNERVQRMPITPEKLWVMANEGHWNINYPEHELPSSRADIFINILIFIAGALLLAYIAKRW
ncbi:DUF1493 family protein [Flaviaesturariibacter amylovorans]|uniref:DUF1493 family protein n=1 Tax=Flaviaesturariibacter amylovorans TaxID=1084520 RepID=A0ABP8GN63_9BACT